MNIIEYLRSQQEVEITLNDWCEAYYECQIVPFPSDKSDLIRQIALRTIELSNNATKTEKRRINEQGIDNEGFLNDAMMETLGGKFKSLGNAYPDIIGETPLLDFPIIADSKIRYDLKKSDSFRIFYTSTPKEKTKKRKKLKTGYHLLFFFEHDGNNSLNGNYKVFDLDGFKYTCKGRIQEAGYSHFLKHGKIVDQSRNGIDVA